MYYIYKDFPLTQAHPQAHLAAEAAECAGEQGKYWEMHSALFASPSEWDTTEQAARSSFDRYAGEIGLDPGAFGACMAEGRYRANVEANFAEGRRLGIGGTPVFIINGKLLTGAQPTDVFKRAFDRELKTSK